MKLSKFIQLENWFTQVRPAKRAWFELLSLAAAAYVLIPGINALTTDRHLGITLRHGDWGLAGFDFAMFGLAGVFAGIAIKLQRKWRVAEAAPLVRKKS